MIQGWPLPFTSLPRLVHPVGQRRLVKERVANERKEVAARIVRFLFHSSLTHSHPPLPPVGFRPVGTGLRPTRPEVMEWDGNDPREPKA